MKLTNRLENRFDSRKDNDELISVIKNLVNEVLNKHASEDEEEKQWLLDNCQNPAVLKKLSDLTYIMLHVLDAIGRLEPVNSISISKDTGIPKGTVSKSIPKLLSKELITKVPLPNNKKEYVFHITPLGKEIFILHQTMHKKMESTLNNFLKQYNDTELQFIIRMLKDFANLSILKLIPF
ncbi:winged helix DNA-binding protein [Anaerocolumna sp. AGMB13025]|uniref:winged helix DNA-binding protein n=1 Tax=Anaerocolumna sp. AGMB13025 TaxID=3039116 RepID=UPI00241F97CE|nr:winged helix DNA-binding protein [Anaerocolumna sp. AGMB13025]WFR56690.1 winged helix DNA-binding protein [Anaerocolumna sp. AGMB13025]